jgi:hypothetical protein
LNEVSIKQPAVKLYVDENNKSWQVQLLNVKTKGDQLSAAASFFLSGKPIATASFTS